MAVTIVTSGQVLLKAGENVSTDMLLDTNLNQYINYAEGLVSLNSNYDFVTNWGSISGSIYAQVVKDAVSNLAAIYAINYDMSQYSSRAEAQTMLDVLRDRLVNDLDLLKDKKNYITS